MHKRKEINITAVKFFPIVKRKWILFEGARIGIGFSVKALNNLDDEEKIEIVIQHRDEDYRKYKELIPKISKDSNYEVKDFVDLRLPQEGSYAISLHHNGKNYLMYDFYVYGRTAIISAIIAGVISAIISIIIGIIFYI
ncbi:MAG: hypothetical protein WBC40_10180 [Halobacteriota archaeon]